MPVVTGTLEDIGATSMASLNARVILYPDEVSTRGSALMPTKEIVAEVQGGGAFSFPNVRSSMENTPPTPYSIAIEWQDAAGNYTRTDFPKFKVVVPVDGGRLTDMLAIVTPAKIFQTGDKWALVQWQPGTDYLAGRKVLSPRGDIVTAKKDHTSASFYDSTMWFPSIQDTRITAVETKNKAQDLRIGSLENTGLPDGVIADAVNLAHRPLIGARVGVGSVNTIPDSEYFDELHNLEAIMGAEADITNWYRGVGATSAADFTATVVPELAANPNRKVLYVLEIDKSNAQFNREFDAQDGIYTHLLATLQAIKDSGYADRVFLAPFHEGNGGGGTPGSIGAYDWQMYDTSTGRLMVPSTSDYKTGTPYGATFRLNTPDLYKQAFRNVVTLARQIGLSSKFVQWFLAANSSDSLAVDGIDRMNMAAGYVGDAYADLIGLSYYNRSGDLRYSDTWPQPGANGLREFYNAFERMTGNPLWLCETGCAYSNQYGDKGQWYSDLIKLVASDELPRVEGMVMFMQDSRKYDDNGNVTAGMDMKLESDAQKQMVGRAINDAKRPVKVKQIPAFSRNLLPVAAADMTTTAGWIYTSGVTLDASNAYTPTDMDGQTRGLRITKPPFVAGDTITSHNIYRRVSKSNTDYVPNDPYVLQFRARASYDGFKIETGIRQDGGFATTIGDEIVLSSVFQDYVVPLSSITDDASLDSWRMPAFNFGNNQNASTAWFDICGLRLTRGSLAQPNVEPMLRPKVRALTNATNLTWNCEAASIYTVTLGQNTTLLAPTGVGYDGQEITLRITQGGAGGWTLNLHSDYYSGSAVTPLAAAPGAKTVLKFQYDAPADRWGLVSNSQWNLT